MAAVEAIAQAPDASRLAADQRLVSVTVLLLLVTVAYFVRTDLTLDPSGDSVLQLRLAMRAFAVGVLVWSLWGIQRARSREALNRVMLVFSLLSVVRLLGLNVLRPQGSALSLRTPLLWLMAFYGGLVAPARQQIIAPLLFTAGLVVLRLTWVTFGPASDLLGDLLVLAVANGIGVMFAVLRARLSDEISASHAHERATRERLEQSLAELTQLRGIIPICSYCKQVRTEQGDWQQIEAYVRGRSEAEFSHGICPSCLGVHHADVVAELDGS